IRDLFMLMLHTPLRVLQSFPTRRSSDLQAAQGNPGIRWGNPVAVRLGPDAAALNAPLFNPANAPAGALLLAFSALEAGQCQWGRSEEHTSELQSRENIVCRLLLEIKKKI